MSSKVDVQDYVGKRFGYLTVIGEANPKSSYSNRFLLRCDCGAIIEDIPSKIIKGIRKSCGKCEYHINHQRIDGRTTRFPRTHKIWLGMLYRCENEKSISYKHYGGRGIKVCDEWKDYSKFEEWVRSKGGLIEGMSIDRIDNDGDYCPENCRIATRKIQSRNTSKNVFITFNGETMCLIDWAEYLKIDYKALCKRYYRGWSVERMLTEPAKKKSRTVRA